MVAVQLSVINGKYVDIDSVVAVKKILVVDRSGYKEKIIVNAVPLGIAWEAEVTVIHLIDRGVPGDKTIKYTIIRNPVSCSAGIHLILLSKTILWQMR